MMKIKLALALLLAPLWAARQPLQPLAALRAGRASCAGGRAAHAGGGAGRRRNFRELGGYRAAEGAR
jgi:hypothetical protein